MHDMKKAATRDVLKKLICMAQEAMMQGLGDDEEAGKKIKEEMVDEAGDHDVMEKVASAESEEMGEEEGLADYIKKEMKRGNRSPIKDRKAVMIVSAKPSEGPRMAMGMSKSGKGKY